MVQNRWPWLTLNSHDVSTKLKLLKVQRSAYTNFTCFFFLLLKSIAGLQTKYLDQLEILEYMMRRYDDVSYRSV